MIKIPGEPGRSEVKLRVAACMVGVGEGCAYVQKGDIVAASRPGEKTEFKVSLAAPPA